MLFYGKNLAQFVLMFETQSYFESEAPNAGVTRIKRVCHENSFVGYIINSLWGSHVNFKRFYKNLKDLSRELNGCSRENIG
jgi:hypothetical protein